MHDFDFDLRNNYKLHEINVFKDIPFIGNWLEFVPESKFNWIILTVFSIISYIIFNLTSKIDNSVLLSTSLKYQRGFWEDYIFLSYFVFVPLIFIAVKKYFPECSPTLHTFRNVIDNHSNNFELPKTGKLKEDSSFLPELNEYLKCCENRILGVGKWKFLKIIFITIGLGWVVVAANTHWHAIEHYGFDIWSSQNYRIGFMVRTIYELITFGIIFPLILYKFSMILVSIRYISKKLTEQKVIKLRPLSPDQAGGLGEIGKYSLKMVTVLLPPLMPTMLYIFFGNVNVIFIFGIMIYIPFLIFTFFYPLSGAHHAMKSFKQKELDRLSHEFNKIYDEFTHGFNTDQLSNLAQRLEILERIDRLYVSAKKMPIWPFDTGTLTKFTGIIVAITASFWLNWLFGKLVS